MKWFSRIAVAATVAGVLLLCLLLRSTRVSDEVEIGWKLATLSFGSANGELSLEASFATEAALVHPGLYPTVGHQRRPLSMGGWGQFDYALFGSGFDAGWNGIGHVIFIPHWSLILGLLAVPAGRLAVRKLRGRAKPPPPGFEVQAAS